MTADLVSILPSAAADIAILPRAQRDEIASKWLREKGARSRHTADRYRRDIGVFFGWADQQAYDVFAMLPWQVGEYAAWLAEGGAGELAESTQAARISSVSSFYRWLQVNVQDRVVHNPAQQVARPDVEKDSHTTKLEADELARFRAVAQERGPREYALVQLLAGAGLRISEALGADSRHLRREGARWYLYVKRKGRGDREPVQVPDGASRAVRRYLAGRPEGRPGPLFLDNRGNRMSRQAAANRVRSIALAAGIDDRKMSPHVFRHTATTLALSEGVPMVVVAAQMGHRSTETTARYDRANRRRNNAAAEALEQFVADDLADPDDEPNESLGGR